MLVYDSKTEDLEEPFLLIETIAQDVGADSVLWQRLANDSTRESRFQVKSIDTIHKNPDRFGTINHDRLDGVILTRSGQAVAFSTRDCLTGVFFDTNPYSRYTLVVHLGRSSTQGADIGLYDRKYSVITNGIRQCASDWKDMSTVHGIITCGIATEHFRNDRYPEITKNLIRQWGPSVVPNPERGTIDLVELVLVQLEQFGINRKNIVHDELDTYTDPGLASKRKGSERHNLILVVYP